jgi:hypothetical protein
MFRGDHKKCFAKLDKEDIPPSMPAVPRKAFHITFRAKATLSDI